jgi:pSer/pThr/pTyr-binding forkhead associated (FHA) protein
LRLRHRNTGETREIHEGMVLGRLAGVDWVVDDTSVSRRHARVVREGATWLVEDLASSNGTLLNGVRGQRFALRPGDLVTFGAVAFDVLAAEDAISAPPESARVAPASAAKASADLDAERERARLHSDLRRRGRSRGFGHLAQQSLGMKFLALLIGLAVLAGVAWGVRIAASLL